MAAATAAWFPRKGGGSNTTTRNTGVSYEREREPPRPKAVKYHVLIACMIPGTTSGVVLSVHHLFLCCVYIPGVLLFVLFVSVLARHRGWCVGPIMFVSVVYPYIPGVPFFDRIVWLLPQQRGGGALSPCY